MEKFPEDSYYLKCMKTVLDAYPQHSPPLHPTKLTERLYIGNQDNADDVSLLSAMEITHVLNCAGTRNFDLSRSPYPPDSGVRGFLMIPAQDYDEFDIARYFETAIDFLDSATASGGKALVHCSIGVNRSGAIAAAYLMASQRKRLMDVIVELKAKRLLILCNMGFRKQLVQFARSRGLLDRVEPGGPRRLPDPSATLPAGEAEVKAQEGEEIVDAAADEGKKDKEEETKSDGEGERKDEAEVAEAGDGSEKQNGDAGPTERQPPPSSPTATITKPDRAKARTDTQPKSEEVYAKRYVYKTRLNPQPPASFSSSSPLLPSQAGASLPANLRNYKNVDSDILLRLVNESYGKYKEATTTARDFKAQTGAKGSPVALQFPSSASSSSSFRPDPASSSLLLAPAHHQKSFLKRSTERELAREVEEFLAANRALTASASAQGVARRSDVDDLLRGKISKEDERLIWGRSSNLADDPEFLLFKSNLEKSQQPPPPTQLPPPPQQQLPMPLLQSVSSKTKPLESLLRKYEDTTTNVILKDLRDLAEAPLKKRIGLGGGGSHELRHGRYPRALDDEDYLKDRRSVLPHPPLQTSSAVAKEPSRDVLDRVSSAKTTGNQVRPISYYRLQVMNEKDSRDPELQRAADEYLLSDVRSALGRPARAELI